MEKKIKKKSFLSFSQSAKRRIGRETKERNKLACDLRNGEENRIYMIENKKRKRFCKLPWTTSMLILIFFFCLFKEWRWKGTTLNIKIAKHLIYLSLCSKKNSMKWKEEKKENIMINTQQKVSYFSRTGARERRVVRCQKNHWLWYHIE